MLHVAYLRLAAQSGNFSGFGKKVAHNKKKNGVAMSQIYTRGFFSGERAISKLFRNREKGRRAYMYRTNGKTSNILLRARNGNGTKVKLSFPKPNFGNSRPFHSYHMISNYGSRRTSGGVTGPLAPLRPKSPKFRREQYGRDRRILRRSGIPEKDFRDFARNFAPNFYFSPAMIT